MSSEQIRQSFLSFFESKGHVIVPSSSLVPDDPSVLLTTAGMQQFKKYYTGELNALHDFGSQRTASIQKCFRTSDIEEVGDRTHLTFFEMLGNFSFGPVGSDDPAKVTREGYFKRTAIHAAYEYITEILEIPVERMHVTVFEGDKEVPFDSESYRIWSEEIGMPKNKIVMGKRTDNFWGPTGNEGPCGPTTELYVDGVEIWNLVFNEFYRESNGHLRKIESPGVDTGMGFERLVTVIQGAESVFETDILSGLVSHLQEYVPGHEKKEERERVVRILADHVRASIILVADGVRPSHKEAGYILRRLIRRVMAYQEKYDIHADVFAASIELVAKKWGSIYPELTKTKEMLAVIEEEGLKFQEAVGRGIEEIQKYKTLTSKDAFYLFETFGLPLELIKELAGKEKTQEINDKEFQKEFERHQEISRAGVEKKFGGHGLLLDTGELKARTPEEVERVIRLHTATHLLQWALREVLGKEVHQTGSDITAERTRFDFSFGRKVTPAELAEVESLVNDAIAHDHPVHYKELPKAEAIETGALHLEKAKYPDHVKVYYIGKENGAKPFSAEFCGGPHVTHTRTVGKIKIVKEEAVAAGIRRIRAVIN